MILPGADPWPEGEAWEMGNATRRVLCSNFLRLRFNWMCLLEGLNMDYEVRKLVSSLDYWGETAPIALLMLPFKIF